MRRAVGVHTGNRPTEGSGFQANTPGRRYTVRISIYIIRRNYDDVSISLMPDEGDHG